MIIRKFGHHGKIRRAGLSLMIALAVLVNSALPAAADSGPASVSDHVVMTASVVTSIADTLESLFEKFLSLFTGGDSDNDGGGSDEYPTLNTADGPQVALGDIDNDNGTFTMIAVNVPTGKSAAKKFEDADPGPDSISVIFRVSCGSGTGDTEDYQGEEGSDGSFHATCQMADFDFQNGSYSMTVLLKSGSDEVQIAEGTGEVKLQNFVYAAVPEDGYGTATVYVVNPLAEDGEEVDSVQFLVKLREAQEDQDTSETPNSGSVLTEVSKDTENTETDTETVAVIGQADTSETDTANTDNSESVSDTSGEIPTETQLETSLDSSDQDDTEKNPGEAVIDADEISSGVWSAEVTPSSYGEGGTCTVEAYVKTVPVDTSESLSSSSSSSSLSSSASSSSDSSSSSSEFTEANSAAEAYIYDESDSGTVYSESDEKSENTIEAGAVPIGTVDFTLWLRDSASVDVPELLQYPELPTGCESVALTIVLKSLGYDLEKTTIVDDYLIYGSNFANSYVGSPYTSHGGGIFGPGLAATANAFLKANGGEYKAKDITGTDFDDLLTYIDEGIPVIVWSTMYMSNVNFTGQVSTYKGREYKWYNTEHCVVICGYDRVNETIHVSDPLDGIVDRDWDAFEQIYETAGENAVVIE